MPTYEYECPDCGHTFEEFQSITARPIRRCPQCGKRRVKRLLGCGAGLIFKGNGFYQTDYRSESYKKSAEAEKGKAGGGKSGQGAGSQQGSGTSAKSPQGAAGVSGKTGSAGEGKAGGS